MQKVNFLFEYRMVSSRGLHNAYLHINNSEVFVKAVLTLK